LFEKIFRAYLDYIEQKYKLKERRKEEIHVHQLIRCKFKSKMEELFPSLIQILTPGIFIGEMVDIGMKELLKFLGGFQTDLELSKEIEVHGEKVKLLGRPDGVSDDFVVEIKYSRVKPSEPLEHHVLQLKLYLFLAEKDKGALLYITPEGFAEFWIEEKPDENFVKELFESWHSPRFEWECSYCIFRRICPFSRTPSERTSQSK